MVLVVIAARNVADGVVTISGRQSWDRFPPGWRREDTVDRIWHDLDVRCSGQGLSKSVRQDFSLRDEKTRSGKESARCTATKNCLRTSDSRPPLKSWGSRKNCGGVREANHTPDRPRVAVLRAEHHE